MIQVNNLFLHFRNTDKIVPVEFIHHSPINDLTALSVWDKVQPIVYFVIEHGVLQSYQVDGSKIRLVRDVQQN